MDDPTPPVVVPLTLAIAETLIVSAAEQTCAVPQSFVSEVMQVTEADVQRVNGIEVIQYRSGVLPIYRLARFFAHESTTQPGPGRAAGAALLRSLATGRGGV